MDKIGAYYNIWIVLLSFALAATAAFSALNLITQVSNSTRKLRQLWLISGASVLGSGIWVVHYIGIVANRFPFEINYYPDRAILSLLVGILFSYLTFQITSMPQVSDRRLIIGGILLGTGISAVHYIGMSSMKIVVSFHYNWWIQGFAITLVMVSSYIGLLMFHKFKDGVLFNRWKLSSALFIGFSVVALYYTSVRASDFELNNMLIAKPFSMENEVILLMGVSLVSLLIFVVSSGAILLDRLALERMAYHDPLTGLPNRQGLDRYFKDEFFEGRTGAVFFVDLDRFKSINDTLGHDIGDMLLQEVADRLAGSIGDKGRVFRLGGDEFLVALPDCMEQSAQEAAKEILSELKKSYSIMGNELYVTASVGISMTPLHGSDRSALMKAADTALYTSKGSGKNKFSMFDQETNQGQLRRMSLEKDLCKALARSEFLIVYQPKWDTYKNVTVGLEALLRWKHPELGVISPAEFIPIAEETGLIVPITHWMLYEVCNQNKHWHKEAIVSVPVSVNMSVRMFEDGNLYEVIEHALSSSELESNFLELEITESIAMTNMVDTVSQLSRLRLLGVSVSLDDFGTGFSALGNLDEIPVNTLKLDQVFIRKNRMHSKKTIISNIITIATNLNMEVVAEGVETSEQIELLQSLGCRVMQGFFYGRPMPAHELNQWFAANDEVSIT